MITFARLGSLLLLGTLLSGPAQAADAGKDEGSISLLKGQVFVNGAKASRSTPIPDNAEIRTGSRSMVAFDAGGDAHVMKSNSSIVIKSDDGSFTSQLRVLGGSLLSAWGKRPPGQQAELVTRTATMGIRGTVTHVGSNGTFTLLKGSVEYKNNNGTTTTLSVDKSGKLVSVDSSGTPTVSTDVSTNDLRALAVSAENTGDTTLAAQLHSAADTLATSGTVTGADSTQAIITAPVNGTASPGATLP